MSHRNQTLTDGLVAPVNVPEPCRRKAVRQLTLFRCGKNNFTRIKANGSDYLKIDIGLFWRLLSKTAAKTGN
ncbi:MULTISPECIES: hypothetical protein [Enterobacteriaceae]|uniref:ParE family toxin-like protein n=1 Tax=Enterobacteriaceae TaxID=543 RepID=UPI001E2889E4|nr:MULTISPECIES: hypothetical protein [Enterobacteriaceae]